jgi:hypothetical protein
MYFYAPILIVLHQIAHAGAISFCSNNLIAQQSLLNGGFEDSAFCNGNPFCTSASNLLIAPWVLTSGSMFELDSSRWQNQQGSWSIGLNSISPSTIAQCVQTTPGVLYKLSFWARTNPCGNTFLKTGFAKTPAIYNFNGTDAESWKQHAIVFNAASDATLIEFGSTTLGSCGPVIDNISLVQTISPFKKF